MRPFLSLQTTRSLFCSMPAGAGPVWGLRPEPPIYVRPSPAPMCPLRWPVPPAPAEFPCPPRTPCPGGWNCGFFRRGAVRTQLPASRGGPARRPDLLPGFPRGGGGRDRGLGGGGHHMTSVRGRALGGGAQHDHGQRCRARC